MSVIPWQFEESLSLTSLNASCVKSGRVWCGTCSNLSFHRQMSEVTISVCASVVGLDRAPQMHQELWCGEPIEKGYGWSWA